MIVTREDATDLMVALGYYSARRWGDDKLVRKINAINVCATRDIDEGDEFHTLHCECLASLVRGNPIKLGCITAVDDEPPKRLSEPHQYRRSPGEHRDVQSLEAVYVKSTKSRRWYAGCVMSKYADTNGYPQLPNDLDALVLEIDDMVVDNGGVPNLRESRNALFHARAVLHGFFTNLTNGEK